MVRAYLSDGPERPFDVCAPQCCPEHAQQVLARAAEDEARMILRETEAGGVETFTYGHHRFEGDYVKTELSRTYCGQGHAELADALRAFIGEEEE